MNKSKILAASGLATVMSATVASADSVSVNGYIEGWFTSGDNTTGVANTCYSCSIYVSYGTTLDNGMGLSVGYTLTNATHAAGFAVDTGMGSLRPGPAWQMASAADKADSLPNNANTQSSNNILGSYNDGDNASGEGILYTSPSINGWTVLASVGENLCSTVVTYPVASNVATKTSTTTCSDDRVTSVAVKGSLMGVSIAAGAVDQVGNDDDSFVTLGYSIGGVGIGYGNYDSDTDDATAISVTTDVAGMTVGFRYDDLEATTDNSMNTYSIGKDFGGMSLTLMYEDQDLANNSEWNLSYAMGF